MKSSSKCPRRGWGELVSELVAFAKKSMEFAMLWQGENAVEDLAREIRKVSGFGGKGFRMKEIVLDLAEAAKNPRIEMQLVDFGVVGPGPRRTLNWINNRRLFFVPFALSHYYITRFVKHRHVICQNCQEKTVSRRWFDNDHARPGR